MLKSTHPRNVYSMSGMSKISTCQPRQTKHQKDNCGVA